MNKYLKYINAQNIRETRNVEG